MLLILVLYLIMKDHLSRLMEMFPDIPCDDLQKRLHKCASIDQAIAELLGDGSGDVLQCDVYEPAQQPKSSIELLVNHAASVLDTSQDVWLSCS